MPGEFATNRSSPTSPNPASSERFVMVDPLAERAWQIWKQVRSASFTQRSLDEQLKSAFLAGWVGHELTAAAGQPPTPRGDSGAGDR
jgi:hypothetical protein